MAIYSQYGSINSHTTLLSKSYASAIHVKIQEREKVLIKYVYLWVRRFSQALPAGTHLLFTRSASKDALYLKGQVRPSEKVKMREFHLQKLTCGHF